MRLLLLIKSIQYTYKEQQPHLSINISNILGPLRGYGKSRFNFRYLQKYTKNKIIECIEQKERAKLLSCPVY